MTPNRKRQGKTQGQGMTPATLTSLVGMGVVGIVGLWLFYASGILDYYRMQQEEAQINRDILELEDSNARLQEEIRRVRHDPATLEALAREQLGFVREGEVVYQLVKPR